ncbi:MAG: 30S ribosomal protein S13 [Candidatus Omnitrophica bacterium]|nr:30S ribosomal protein S13 [Candidatus Omnitrophota bacterium]
MPRLVGVDIPKEKRIEISLMYIYGIGRTLSNKILKSANINPDKRAKDLTEEEVARIASIIQRDYKVEGDLRREISANIKRLIDAGTYRGYRHRRGLPVRGQRSRTNARTRKGPRKTVGVIRAKAAAATAKPASEKK